MADIVLTAGVRSNLLQLQKTSDLITATQTKLATGKRVNSALDISDDLVSRCTRMWIRVVQGNGS